MKDLKNWQIVKDECYSKPDLLHIHPYEEPWEGKWLCCKHSGFWVCDDCCETAPEEIAFAADLANCNRNWDDTTWVGP